MIDGQDTLYIHLRPNGRYYVRIPAGRGDWATVGTFGDLATAQAERDRALAETQPEETPAERKQDQVDGNTRNVVYTSPDVRTLDDLIRACQIDLNEWAVTRWEANKWAVGAKTAKRRLFFSGGKMEGEIDDQGQFTVAPLFQVKAWLVRREPIAIRPVVQPITVTARRYERTPGRRDGLKRALCLPDPQIGFRRDWRTGRLDPFHDRQALSVALQIAQDNRFDRIIWLGDLIDCSEWSDKYLAEDGFYFTTQPAICEAWWWLNQFAQEAESDLLEGNHDNRIPRALQAHMRAAYSIRPADEIQEPAALSIERLLCLDKTGVNWAGGYPNNAVWLTDDLRCVHGDIARNGPGSTAAKLVEATVSTVFGHIHRIEHVSRTEYRRGETCIITAASPGCLCRLDGAVPGHTRNQSWQQGVAVVTYGDGYQAIETVPIQDGRAAFAGKLYQAQDQLTRIGRDTGWDFSQGV